MRVPRCLRRVPVVVPAALLFPLAVLVLAPPAAAQWADVHHAPGDELVASEGWLAQRGSTGWQVFSGSTRTWRPVAPATAELVVVAERAALFADGADLVAYSAVDGAVQPLSVTALEFFAGEGDILAAVESGKDGLVVHGFSATTSEWTALSLVTSTLAPIDVAVGGGVMAVRDSSAYHGFAGRLGTWSTLELGAGEVGQPPNARGEVALAYLPEISGVAHDRMLGFSGVLGVWDAVEDLHFSSSTLLGTHVALVRVQHPILTRFYPSGFSAYTGRWATDFTQIHAPTSVVQYGGESVVALENIGVLFNLCVFHARPGTWSVLSGQRVVVAVEGDTLVAEHPATGELTAASGLRTGFAHAPSVPPHGAASGSGHLALVANNDFDWRAYSPATGAWSELVPGVDFANGASVAALIDGFGQTRAWSTRGGTWVPGPALAPGSTTSAVGSIVAWHDGSDGSANVFDGRRGAVVPAPVAGVPGLQVAARVVLAAAGSDVWAYSARRGDWALAGDGAPVAPFAVPPTAQGDVAWFVDGAERLWAFGAGRDVEPARDWPEGQAVNLPAPVTGEPAPMRLTLHGAPGEAALLFAAAALGPPLALPGVGGLLELSAGGAFLLGLGVLDSGGTWALDLPVPGGVPPGVHLWLQSVRVDPVTLGLAFGAGAADVWIF